MAQKQMAEQRADDRQPDTIAKHRIDGRWRVSPSTATASTARRGRSSVGTPLADVKRRARIGQRLTIVRTSLRARSPATLGALIADQNA